jgi:Flp pilus assembly protein TadG
MPSRMNIPGLRALRRLGEDQGNAAVEFALILPVLMTILFGALKFCVALNQQVTLNQAVDAAARYVSVCRAGCPASGSTPSATTYGPWLGTEYAMDVASPTLNSTTLNSSLTMTMTNSSGTSDGSCTGDTNCAAALTTDGGGGRVTVTATYSCDLKILSVDFAPGCKMQAQTTAIIE